MTTNINVLSDFVQEDKIVMIDFYDVNHVTGEQTFNHSQEMGEYKNSGSICLHDGVEIRIREADPVILETKAEDPGLATESKEDEEINTSLDETAPEDDQNDTSELSEGSGDESPDGPGMEGDQE